MSCIQIASFSMTYSSSVIGTSVGELNLRVWFAAHINTKHDNDVVLHTHNMHVIYILCLLQAIKIITVLTFVLFLTKVVTVYVKIHYEKSYIQYEFSYTNWILHYGSYSYSRLFLRGGRGGGETDFFLLSGGVDGPGLDRLATAASLVAEGF